MSKGNMEEGKKKSHLKEKERTKDEGKDKGLMGRYSEEIPCNE